MLRAIREIQPCYVVGENVSGILSWNGGLVFNEVQTDLEAAGYEVLPFLLPACGVNAPHKRERVWFIAYSKSDRDRGRIQRMESENGSKRKSEECRQDNNEHWNDGTKRTTTDTNSNGQYRRNSQHEINASERRLNALGNIEQGIDNGYAADPNGTRREELYIATKSTEQENNSRDALYSHSPGEQREHIRQEREREFDRPNSRIGINDFTNFPTQSPIRCRNDGISTELVGITVSKHRNESIKAYGNAIVPAVALQIFKAIEAFDSATP
jgi:DNA (cytosine-5)-methyltransferase 1